MNPIKSSSIVKSGFQCLPDNGTWQWQSQVSGHFVWNLTNVSLPQPLTSGTISLQSCVNVTPHVLSVLQNFQFDGNAFRSGCLAPTVILSHTSSMVISRLWIRLNDKNSRFYPNPYNQLVVTELNTNNQPQRPSYILGIPTHLTDVSGPEDPRFLHDRAILFGAHAVVKKKKMHMMHIWNMNTNALKSLVVRSFSNVNEKNWAFIDLKELNQTSLYFVHRIIPLTVLKCPIGKDNIQQCELFFQQKSSLSMKEQYYFSGSTNFHRYGNTHYFYSFIHSKGYQCAWFDWKRLYESHLVVIHWPVFHQPSMRLMYISDPLSYHSDFLSLKPPPDTRITAGFAFPVSLFSLDEENDIAYLSVHRSDSECWLLQLRGLFTVLGQIIETCEHSSGMMQDEMDQALTLYNHLVKLCSRWKKNRE